MLLFFSKKQARLQEKNNHEENWQRRRNHISAERKHPDDRPQLINGSKEWIGQESLRERTQRRDAATAQSTAVGAQDIPEYDA
jgi:hypothetical protein